MENLNPSCYHYCSLISTIYSLENEAKFYDGDKSIPQKFSEDLVATTILTDAPQGRNGLKRKMPNQFSLKAPFHPPKPISKSIKLAHTKHSNIDVS